MSKSRHHQSENTHRFQTFSERLTQINIDVIHKTGRIQDAPRDSETFFGEALDKWRDLCLDEHFTLFSREVMHEVQTFEQLVHHEEIVVSALLRHLQVPNSLAIEALLDLVVQLARDLQSNFFQRFPVFFQEIVGVLERNVQNSSVIEQSFQCLSYLFKYQWRYMVKNMQEVYELYAPLLQSNRKDYITNFAAESFSFLMRKYKERHFLFNFMIKSIEEHPDRQAGVARLFFEMMKGVQKQFHSCMEQVLPMLLSKLGPFSHLAEKNPNKSDVDEELLAETLARVMASMAGFTNKDNAQPLWSILLTCTTGVHAEWVKARGKRRTLLQQQVHRTLRLLKVLVEFRNGSLIADPCKLQQVLVVMLKESLLSEDCANTLLEISSSLLLASRVTLEIETVNKLVSAVFKSKYSYTLLFSFTRRMFPSGMFEKDVLPGVLHLCHDYCNDGKAKEAVVKEIWLLLTELVLKKSPPMLDASGLESYTPYSLDFRMALKGKKQPSFPDLVVSAIDDCASLGQLDSAALSRLWAALFIAPCVRPLDKAALVKAILPLLGVLKDMASKEGNDTNLALFVLCQAVQVLMHVQEAEDLFSSIKLEFITSLIKAHPDNIHALRITDLYVTKAAQKQKELLSPDLAETLYTLTQDNLSSCYSKIRLLNLHILSQFNLPMPELEDIEMEQPGIFKIALASELVSLDVYNSRDKELQLQKLDAEIVTNNIPIGPYTQAPLRYLIGQFHVNFSMVWDKARQLIASHAQALDREVFWEIYLEQLKLAAQQSEQALLQVELQELPVEQGTISAEPCLVGMMSESDGSLRREERPPDFTNFRHQLWTAMLEFPGLCQAKSRDVSPLFFQFLRNEYYFADDQEAPSQDIRKKDEDMDTSRSHRDDEEEKDNEKEDEDDEKEDDKEEEKESFKKNRKAASKSLVVHLKLFSTFNNPKAVHMEPQLKELYYKLLNHRSHAAHKVAYECIMTYKYKFLTPYRENFDRLLDDKTFKHEIVLFGVDSEAGVIKDDHREGMLPILMRILYGKMQSQTGKDSSGKFNSNFRKATVMKFLAGSKQEELKVFIDLILQPIQHLVGDDAFIQVQKTMNEVDLAKIIPLRRLQGILSTIEVIFQRLGNLINDYLPSLLQILLCVAGLCGKLLNSPIREQLKPGATNRLKIIRKMVSNRVFQFISSYDSYAYSTSELNALFEGVIWPQLEKLPHEGQYQPTPLLKLFHLWSEKPRFRVLLSKHHPDRPEFYPLPYIVALLSAKLVHKNVTDMVMSITENLVFEEEKDKADSEEGEEDEDVAIKMAPLEVDHCLDVTKDKDGEKVEGSYGFCLLLPHIPPVLKHLSGVVKAMVAMRGKNKTIPVREMNILSFISNYVKDSELRCSLIKLLLPFLGRNMKRTTESEKAILTIINNLIKLVEKPGQFIGGLSKCFSCLTQRTSRVSLCRVIETIGNMDERYKTLADLTVRMNAWNKRRLDEPDFDARLDGFSDADQFLVTMETPDTELIQMLIHNCTYFLANVDDMALRDRSTLLLKNIVSRLSELGVDPSSPSYGTIMNSSLLPEIRAGIKAKAEICRHEFIGLLGHTVRAFPNSPIFDQLSILTNSDSDMDFFENIVHIQHHRRARALRKMPFYLSSTTFRADTLLQIILPLVNSFLQDECYAKFADLIEASVEATGAICSYLPWSKYMQQLQTYLRKLTRSLDNHKLMIRLVVTILDAFPFDLSGTKEIHNFPVLPENADEKAETTLGEENDEDDTKEDEDEESGKKEGEGESSEKVAVAKVDGNSQQAALIHQKLVKGILPQLHKCLTQKAKSEGEHKLAGGKYAEDEEILRVPLALAMVKLLQKLPKGTLERSLPSVLLKVCQFLRSRADGIRDTARETLIKIVNSLGPKYLSYVLKEMRGTLIRGYQLHVLCYTIHALLAKLSPILVPGEIDNCVPILIQVFNEELFGNVAEEKLVAGIKSKVFEARSSKSYESYEIVATFIKQGTLSTLLKPLKEKLDSTHKHKVTKKVEEALRKIGQGLLNNDDMSARTLLIFTHGLASDSLPQLVSRPKAKTAAPPLKPGQKPPSCLLLQATPQRGWKAPLVGSKTNTHILVEFSLQVLHMLLKRGKLSAAQEEHLQMTDPFVDILVGCLSSKHIKVTTIALRCLCSLLKFPLPSLRQNIEKVINSLFVLLKNYAVAGAAKGDNFEMVVICFKAMTVVVRDLKYHTISTEQLQVLLTYAEEDIHDHTRQGTAFGLLKAIVSRKLNVPELGEVILKLEKLSVTAHSPHARLQCRQVVLQFLLDYPLGEELKKHLEMYVTQLQFEYESGRESVLEMLATMFSSFPQTLLSEYAGFFFLPMATALVNDDSTKCRKLTALAIKSLLEKLPSNERDSLFSINMLWFQEDKVNHRRLASQVCGLFAEVETTKFERRLPEVLPVISQQLEPGRYEMTGTYSEERDADHLLYNTLMTLSKVLHECNLIRSDKWQQELASIWESVQKHLLHPHVWVRLASAQLFGLLFAAWQPEEIVKLAKDTQTDKTASIGYLHNDTREKVRRLTSAFLSQFQEPEIVQDLADQIIKNLVYVAKVIHQLSESAELAEEEQEEKDEDNGDEQPQEGAVNAGRQQKPLSLKWMIKRLSREARFEASQNQKSTLKRSCVFKCFAAVAMYVDKEGLVPLLPLMLGPLHRDINNSTIQQDDSLKTLALDVVGVLKKLVGVQGFSKQYTTTQRASNDKRETRKRLRAEEVIAHPEIAARKKIKKNIKKQEAKKRRVETLRPTKRSAMTKKQKLAKLEAMQQ